MLRVALQQIDDDDTEGSVTVAEAARRLGCDEATVRALLREGELSGHKVGKCSRGKKPRGVRVHAWTIAAYKRRNAVGAPPPAANDPAPAPRPAVHSVSAADAIRRLRARGVLR